MRASRLLSFDGRISRREYWTLAAFLGAALALLHDCTTEWPFWLATVLVGWLMLVATAKRLHDVDCSAAWLLVHLCWAAMAVLGPLVLHVMGHTKAGVLLLLALSALGVLLLAGFPGLLQSNPAPNAYGPLHSGSLFVSPRPPAPARRTPCKPEDPHAQAMLRARRAHQYEKRPLRR